MKQKLFSHRFNQSGIAHLALPLLLIVVLAVAFIGYRILQHSSAATTSVNDTAIGTGLNQFSYTGAWSGSQVTGAYQNNKHYTNASGAYYTFQFSGTQVKVYTEKSSNTGIAGYSIDGGAETLVDGYSSTRQNQALVYTSPIQASGTHTLKVRNTGTKNSASTGTYLAADRLDIIAPDANQATLALAPPSGKYSAGSTIAVAVNATSISTPITTVQAAINYPTSQLQYVSTTTGTDFPTAQRTSTSTPGMVDIIRSVPGGSVGVTGTKQVVTVNFKVLSNLGSAALTFGATSGIYDNSGSGQSILSIANSQPAAYTLSPKTYAGACPMDPGGYTLASAQSVLDKWGPKAAVRIKAGADLTAGPVHPAGAAIVHTSFTPDVASVNSGSLDTQIEALVSRTPAGDIIEFYHEADAKGLTGTSLTDLIAAKNRLYDIKQRVKPTVLVASTMRGQFFAKETTDTTRSAWAGMKGDLVGVDLTAVHDSNDAGPTYDTGGYSDEMTNAQKWVSTYASKGWKGWTVPALGTSRRPWDTTGTPRAAWFDTQYKLVTSTTMDPYAVMAFDFNAPPHITSTDYNRLIAGTAEHTLWKKYVDIN